MSTQLYYPTWDEIKRLGFEVSEDEAEEMVVFIQKGHLQTLELINDNGVAMLVEWWGGNGMAWTVCDCYEALEHIIKTSFTTPNTLA